MARTTPTYTPPGKYVLGCLFSIVLLISDLNYQTFSPLRGAAQASGIYSQLILESLFENITEFKALYREKKVLIKTNQKLNNELLQIENKAFLKKQAQLLLENMVYVQNGAQVLSKQRESKLFQIASFDFKNYFCCSRHTIYLKNPSKLKIRSNLPVSDGKTFIGQTAGMDLNLIKVILFSDTSHNLPIKIKEVYCNASGAGKPLLVSCFFPRGSQSLNLQINDTVFTSGMGGIFPKNILLGTVMNIADDSLDGIKITIRLKGNPLEKNYFGVLLD